MLRDKNKQIHKTTEKEKIKKRSEELLAVLKYYNFVEDGEIQDKFKIVCPFHNDENASLQINLDSGTFYCYGCEAKGFAEDFVKLMEKGNDLKNMIVFNKAINSNEKSNIKIKRAEAISDKELLKHAKLYYFSLPKTNWKKIKKTYLHKRGFKSRILSEVGAKINTNDSYKFIFPMYDNNIFKGYVCRTDKKEVEKHRKYLYNKGFSRSNTLVGNYFEDWLFIVEGYMDWLKMRSFGINNVVAILGWKITPQQVEKIKSVTNKVVSALDNTKTGRDGTKVLKKYFEVVRLKYPENVKDPGDMDEFDFNFILAQTKEKIKKYENKKEI